MLAGLPTARKGAPKVMATGYTRPAPTRREASMRREIRTAVTWATVVTLGLAGLIVAGSRNLSHFDAPLVAYTFASLFAAFGIAYRYAMWLQRPPTAVYWRRGFAGVPAPRAPRFQPAPVVRARGLRLRGQRLHLEARPPPRPHPHAAHVGLHPGRRHHLPARLRLDPLRGAGRPARLVPDRGLRLPHRRLPGGAPSSPSSCSTAWCGRPSS